MKLLSKYTSLPILMEMLESKEIKFVNPRKWDDENERFVFDAYLHNSKKKSVFAYCLSGDTDGSHYWNAFAQGPYSCRIEFHVDKLLKHFDLNKLIVHKEIVYHKIKDITILKLMKPSDILFIKRWPYKAEKEYRAIVIEDDQNSILKDFYPLNVDLDVIKRVTVCSKVSDSFLKQLRKYIKGFNPNIMVVRSTLNKSTNWIKEMSMLLQ